MIIVRETEGGMIFCIVKSTNVKVRCKQVIPYFTSIIARRNAYNVSKTDIRTRRLEPSR